MKGTLTTLPGLSLGGTSPTGGIFSKWATWLTPVVQTEHVNESRALQLSYTISVKFMLWKCPCCFKRWIVLAWLTVGDEWRARGIPDQQANSFLSWTAQLLNSPSALNQPLLPPHPYPQQLWLLHRLSAFYEAADKTFMLVLYPNQNFLKWFWVFTLGWC